MPTPAARATASRLASAPPALKTAFAASRTRSRLRTASARGFRVLFTDCLIPMSNLNRLEKRRYPPYMGSGHADTQCPRQANGDEPELPPSRWESSRSSIAEALGNLIVWRSRRSWIRAHQSAVSLNHGCFG